MGGLCGGPCGGPLWDLCGGLCGRPLWGAFVGGLCGGRLWEAFVGGLCGGLCGGGGGAFVRGLWMMSTMGEGRSEFKSEHRGVGVI